MRRNNRKTLIPAFGLLSCAVLGCSGGGSSSIAPAATNARTSAAPTTHPATPTADDGALYPAKQNGLIGYVNAEGKFVIPPQFTGALHFDGKLAAAQIGWQADGYPARDQLRAASDQKIGFIDRSGRFVIPPKFRCAERFHGTGYTIVAMNPTGETQGLASGCKDWTLIDESGRQLMPNPFARLVFNDGPMLPAAIDAAVAHPSKPDCTSPQARRLETCLPARPSQAELVSRRWGFVSRTGEWIIPADHDYVSNINDNRAFVVKGCTSAMIDDTGHLITEYKFDGCEHPPRVFSEGIAPAAPVRGANSKPTLYGYVDKAGVFVIAPQFDDAESFVKDIARVSISGLWGYVDRSGHFVINPMYRAASVFSKDRAAVCTTDDRLAFIDRSGAVQLKTELSCEAYFDQSGHAIPIFAQSYTAGVFTYVDARTVNWTLINATGKVIYKEAGVVSDNDAKQNAAGNTTDAAPKTGTAFVISGDGFLLTNAHVVEGCSTVALPAMNAEVAVVKTDVSNDLALLHGDFRGHGHARLARAEDLALGTDVVIFGFPLSGLVASSGNLTTGVVSGTTGLGDDSRYFQLTAPVQPGNSGGPVLNQYGEVIGITSGTLNQRASIALTGSLAQNINFALGPSIIHQFLSVNAVVVDGPPMIRWFKQDSAALAARAATFTYLIKCNPQKSSP
jgi:S1-C subfamily serine protease